MKFTACLLISGLICFHLPAVENLRLPDTRCLALGGNGVTQSAFHNPSLLALSTGKVLHFDYFNRYGLKELGTLGGSYQHVNPLLPLGLQLSTFGYDAYRETQVRWLAGKRVASKWSVGIGLHYTWWQTEWEDNPPGRLACDVGAAFSPFDNLLIGMLISDFPSFKVGKKETVNKEDKAYKVEIGFQWLLMNDLLIAGSLGSDEAVAISGQLGMEYRLFEVFSLRAGLQTDPFQPAAGVGYRLRRVTFDVASVYHPVLGLSTGLGLTFSF